MAELATTTKIRGVIAARLREITIANGYRTEIGTDVRTEPSKFEAGDGSRVTVYSAKRQLPADARARTEREMEVIIETVIPVSMLDPLAQIEAAEADIEQALAQYLQQPMAIPFEITDAIVIDRPDGLPVMAMHVVGTTRYR